MKKNHSATTNLIQNTKMNNLGSLKTKAKEKPLEPKELSTESDYRSVLSQLPHNDFEFLQRLTAEKKLKLLIKAHERKSDKRRSEEEITEQNPEVRIPNIFDNQDPILNNSKQNSESSDFQSTSSRLSKEEAAFEAFAKPVHQTLDRMMSALLS